MAIRGLKDRGMISGLMNVLGSVPNLYLMTLTEMVKWVLVIFLFSSSTGTLNQFTPWQTLIKTGRLVG